MNDGVYQPDRGIETATEDPTMGFYTQVDLPFYYDLAQKFAIDDRYFASVIGPTLPNRLYLLAATSFGHVSTGDVNYLPPDGLKPRYGHDPRSSRQPRYAGLAGCLRGGLLVVPASRKDT